MMGYGLSIKKPVKKNRIHDDGKSNIPGEEVDVESMFARLPQCATTIAAFSSENPLFKFVKMKDDACYPSKVHYLKPQFQ